LRVLAAVFWRGRWTIIACLALCIALGGFYAYRGATRSYTATSTFLLVVPQEAITNIPSILSGATPDTTSLNSEIEVIQSRELVGQVVDALHLTRDPEFNPALRSPGYLARAAHAFAHLTGAEAPPAETEAQRRRRLRDATITAVIENMSAQLIPNTKVMDLTIRSRSGRRSAAIADHLADAYVQDQLQRKIAATKRATLWLSRQVQMLQKQLETAQAKLATFSTQISLFNETSLAMLQLRLKDIRRRIVAARDRVAELTEQRQTLQVEGARADAAKMDAEIARQSAQIPILSRSRDSLAAKVQQQSQDLIRQQQMTREVTADQALYHYFLARLKQTLAQSGTQKPDSRVISRAVVPKAPSSPRKSHILVLAGLLGLVLGLGTVLVREARRATFRRARGLEEATGLPVLGQIPLFPIKARAGLLRYLRAKPASAEADALRSLRTALLLRFETRDEKVVMVSSSVPGEGKSSLSLALAASLAQMGKSVLLIEGDLRRRIFHHYLADRPAQAKGLASVLRGETPMAVALIHDAMTGADILMADEAKGNAADLLSSDAFVALIARLRGDYDLILIDTPPVLVVPEARAIAQLADWIAFVVRWESTSQAQVQNALRLFETVNRPVSGLILNQIDRKRMARYGYRDSIADVSGQGAQGSAQ
ncbi:polysaccharide biosynthesis tyrosine autokinase, partial [Thioclava sp. BHET1]